MPDQKIPEIEYLDNEVIPELPGFMSSVVDVRCRDNFGRFFIFELQMYWTRSFEKRMLFNSGKAYVKQLKNGGYGELVDKIAKETGLTKREVKGL